MDYGHTTTPPLTASTTSQNPQISNDVFASAITPGVGSFPEGINPDLEGSLNTNQDFSRASQSSLGSAALNIDPYFPPEMNQGNISVAGITEATRINSIDELNQPQKISQRPYQPEAQAISELAESAQILETTDVKIETVTPPEKHKDNHPTIDYGKRFTPHDIETVESTIRKNNLTELYNLIQNTREKNSEGERI